MFLDLKSHIDLVVDWRISRYRSQSGDNLYLDSRAVIKNIWMNFDRFKLSLDVTAKQIHLSKLNFIEKRQLERFEEVIRSSIVMSLIDRAVDISEEHDGIIAVSAVIARDLLLRRVTCDLKV